MGWWRQVTLLDDDDGSADEAPKAKPTGGGASEKDAVAARRDEEQERPEETQTTRRRRGRPKKRRAPESDEVQERPEETLTTCRPRGRPNKRRAPECDEVRERPEETQTTRRRRGRPKQRRPPESDEEAEVQPEEQQQQVEENMAPVPIGDPVKVTGKRKKHYASFEYKGKTFELEDSVLVMAEEISQKPYVAIIKDITETEGSLSITGQWFYRPEEVEIKDGGSRIAHDSRELFYSFHINDVPAESVMHRCVVHFISLHKQVPSRKQHPGFIVQKVYGAMEKKLWNLTNKNYKDNKQQEIDLLVKKTMDRIGELSDLKPEDTLAPGDQTDHLSNKQYLRKKDVNPIDVTTQPPSGKSEHFANAATPRSDKAKTCPSDNTDNLSYKCHLQKKDVNPIDVTREPPSGNSEHIAKVVTPGTDKPKNYAILVRNKASDQYRDKWIDKLLESVPLASKESAGVSHSDPVGAAKSSTDGSSAKEVDSDDNGKLYALDDVVPIMFALERSAYEALGGKFKKYNQKLRQLFFNIKNSSKLRRRLMDKELDPPVLLTMSPDELKAGLTSAEKSMQWQMTNARCQICQEMKVGISDKIHAGHGDHYQLECTSCGHKWFSSYDAVSLLTADGPTTAAGNVSSTAVPPGDSKVLRP